MLRLLLLRHAKAAPHGSTPDHDRALTERGRADAARLGAFVAGEGIAPQAAFHSGARRTKETLAIVLGKLGPSVSGVADARLYNATNAAYLDFVRHIADAAKTVLVVGHNPTIAETANRLTGTGDPAAMARMAARFPTSALAVLDFTAEHWREIDEAAGRLVYFVTPGSLGARDD